MDEGVGIRNIHEVKEPLYTSKPHLERSGMGFTIMESFMDSLEIISKVGSWNDGHHEKAINKNENSLSLIR